MGSYLSKPVTDKVSEDMENETLTCGVSSMQGWRETQEDTHNCLLEFDTKVSLFAVYDGHGGDEVSRYAAENLPKFVKNELFEKGDYEKALIKAYLDFDSTLVEPSVVEKLTTIREEGGKMDVCSDDEDDEEDELTELHQEAEMPIAEIIKKYTNCESKVDKADSSENSKDNSSNEVEKSDDSSLRNHTATSADNTKDISNGVDDSKSEAIGSKDESVKVNGTSNNDKQSSSEEAASVNNETVCGPSSSSSSSSNPILKCKDIGGLVGNVLHILGNDGSDDDNSEDEMFDASREESCSDDESDEDKIDLDELDDEEDAEEEDDDEEEEEGAGKDSGCTAVLALLVNNKLYVANAGDSRCVVSVDGKAYDMSNDHKPEDEPELSRILKAGGRVTNDGRVNGGLNLSRALGDHNYKKNTDLPNTEQMITALPDVKVLDNVLPGDDNFIVLACDGIWNSLSSQQVVDFISERIKKTDKLSSICEELFDQCLAPNTLSDGTGCDNMTCIIVKLKQNQKRPRTDSEGNNDTCDKDPDCKKLKSNSAESESVQ